MSQTTPQTSRAHYPQDPAAKPASPERKRETRSLYLAIGLIMTLIGAVCILTTIALPVGLFLAPAGVLLTLISLILRKTAS